MCFKYECISCKVPNYDYCGEYIATGLDWCNITLESPWGGLGRRCQTCDVVKGAILKLKTLVLREPWLLTEGVGGAPPKAAWEMEGEEARGAKEEDSDGDDADGWSKEERKKIRAAAVASIMEHWDLLRAEQTATEEGKK